MKYNINNKIQKKINHKLELYWIKNKKNDFKLIITNYYQFLISKIKLLKRALYKIIKNIKLKELIMTIMRNYNIFYKKLIFYKTELKKYF